MKGRTKRVLFFAALAMYLAATVGCHRHKHQALDPTESQEPDRILFEKSLEDIKNKRFEVARLTLQTLLNAYPDSDFLADAKLAIADSYYEESGGANLTHAEVEYKDFITFFPNSPEAGRAQYRAAMCSYRRLELPDRDTTYALRAEREFQLLLRNFPESEYTAEGERKLLEVQEVLAEGQFRVGRFYYVKKSYLASISRLNEVVQRYPNYSKRDRALWMLARVYHVPIPPSWPGDQERAAHYYGRIVREHPLGSYFEDAKVELARMERPLPEPDPVLLARAQNIETVGSKPDRPGLLGRVFRRFTGRPDTSAAAARLGPPPLEPPENISDPALPAQRAAGSQGSSVSVQTAEDLPAGTVQTVPADAEDQGTAAAKNQQVADATQRKNQKQASRKKKSFWRKLLPF